MSNIAEQISARRPERVGSNWLARLLDRLFARRRRTLPAKMLSEHLLRDIGLVRLRGCTRDRRFM